MYGAWMQTHLEPAVHVWWQVLLLRSAQEAAYPQSRIIQIVFHIDSHQLTVLACDDEHVALCTLSMAGCPGGAAVHHSETALEEVA
jgi:hypothetical protein